MNATSMPGLDRRLHAYRPDLADESLRGKVQAQRYIAGRPARVAQPVADLRSAPRFDAGIDTQLLCGDDVLVFEEREGWAWVQSRRDSYVGYVPAEALGPEGKAPTHIVTVPRSFVYPAPELKMPPVRAHSMGARLCVVGREERRGTRYALLASGEAMIAGHLRPVPEAEADYVAAAEQFLHTPYLWGGASGFGIDCSGLVQLSLFMAGRNVVRDTDMQAASLGKAIDPNVLRRGDLVFWKGHVAIMTDGKNMIHANGHTMTVAHERLDEAVARIARLYGQPTGYRRP